MLALHCHRRYDAGEKETTTYITLILVATYNNDRNLENDDAAEDDEKRLYVIIPNMTDRDIAETMSSIKAEVNLAKNPFLTSEILRNEELGPFLVVLPIAYTQLHQ